MITEEKTKSTLKSDLQRLGFSTAALTVDRRIEVARKMARAGEHYRVVTDRNFDRFNKALKRKTLKMWKQGRQEKSTWQTLNFTPIQNYSEIPPEHVLKALKEAKERECFDGFEVATLKFVEKTKQLAPPDPVLFGVINDCDSKYYIAQWDEDLAIEDILKRGEG